MKRLLGVVIIEVQLDTDTIYKIFEAKNFGNNIDILNNYADPLHEPILKENKDFTIRWLPHEPNPKFWNHVTTERCFYQSPDQVFELITKKLDSVLNPLEI